MALAKSATSVVTSRSLKWHLVRFRDFWSENSKKGYLSLPEKSLFQLCGPFFKILSSRKKYNCHFYHRYANCWFWFYWQPMKVSTFVDIWSKVRCVCRTNPRSNVWLLAYTTVFRSLFSAPLVPFRSFFFWEIVVPFWSLLGTLFFRDQNCHHCPLKKWLTTYPWNRGGELFPS